MRERVGDGCASLSIPESHLGGRAATRAMLVSFYWWFQIWHALNRILTAFSRHLIHRLSMGNAIRWKLSESWWTEANRFTTSLRPCESPRTRHRDQVHRSGSSEPFPTNILYVTWMINNHAIIYHDPYFSIMITSPQLLVQFLIFEARPRIGNANHRHWSSLTLIPSRTTIWMVDGDILDLYFRFWDQPRISEIERAIVDL
jgi:hypothetical protein